MEPNHQTYLLTCDVPELLSSFETIGLRTNIELATRLDARLHERLYSIFEGKAEVVVLPMAEIRRSVQLILSGIRDCRNVVVTNRLLHPHEATPCFEINRLVKENGVKLGLGPRPWHELPSEQIARIAQLCGPNPIVILEDGSWSGHTVAQLVADCDAHGVEVSDVICGILFPEGHNRIVASGFRGQLHCAFYCPSCIDWMPDHDFFPFLPCSGKVLGEKCESECRPVRVNASSVSFPYILPYGDPVDWASIPTEQAHPFSVGCLTDCIELFEDMGSINGVAITLEMIAQLYPRASFPQRLQDPRPVPPPATPILDILWEDHAALKERML